MHELDMLNAADRAPVKSVVQVYFPAKNTSLVCDCFCSYTCKHEFAAMLQLRETLSVIRKHCPDWPNGYFAAVSKSAFFHFAVESRESGSIAMRNE